MATETFDDLSVLCRVEESGSGGEGNDWMTSMRA